MGRKADKMVKTDAKAVAEVVGVGAGEHRTTGQDAHVVHDYDLAAMRMQRMDQDTGTDERYQVMGADHGQTGWVMESGALIDKAKHQAKLDSMEVSEREYRLKHQMDSDAQVMRHYEDMHTLRWFSGAGFFADTVQEAFANRVAEKVCKQLKGDDDGRAKT